ncbi:MAG: ABC transporter ATP-binding protein, partial [Lachnospiraceae bacterium]|nr:ABC transporter ATP-binding protein [Lachnospiraceae bacterium]
MKRLLTYLKPHKWQMVLSSILVIALIGVELYKPIIIGNAIDNYIGSYGQPGVALGMEEAFQGILRAGMVYALMLVLGFIFNASNTWILQNVGQSIIYKMREEVFTHIHRLSVNFFNTQPVGKLVTRVSNDTEAVNELFSQILAKLFKNTVKIVGFAVVMLSIDVRMALYSFVLIPFVTALTFFFRYMSRKAYRLTRTRITELNTFLSEHISGMKLIQIFAREKEKYKEFEWKSEQLFRANWREVMTFAIFRPSIY